ncbi:hypothetical protein B0H14DRAFT_2645565 [Mycena olivaceomarginata]|nr:hypothetical protein B0H14DRAFT_2645565 [Mycena olivaceomarginata]
MWFTISSASLVVKAEKAVSAKQQELLDESRPEKHQKLEIELEKKQKTEEWAQNALEKQRAEQSSLKKGSGGMGRESCHDRLLLHLVLETQRAPLKQTDIVHFACTPFIAGLLSSDTGVLLSISSANMRKLPFPPNYLLQSWVQIAVGFKLDKPTMAYSSHVCSIPAIEIQPDILGTCATIPACWVPSILLVVAAKTSQS